MIIRSTSGELKALTTASPAAVTTDYAATIGQSANYLNFYTSQPNVRTCVEFLARNIAQLGIHVFRRRDDNDRERLANHPLALTLESPNPSRTRYRLIEELVTDMGIFFNAYWLKKRLPDRRLQLFRLPPYQVEVEGGLLPYAYYWTAPNGSRVEIAPSDVVHFSGYGGLGREFMGISPLETLRGILNEEREATHYRQSYWRNAARIEGIFTRAKDTVAGKWSNDQVGEWAAQHRALYGPHGRNAGGSPVLPVGMDFKNATFNARDSEYVSGGKLRREICASSYHIPLPMVGILDHATFSNIKEQHKQTYADCLGPWCEMFSEEFDRQILPEFEDVENIYNEFNIAEKLKGDFEEQAAALQTLVGRPVMTVNEGRARLNLPRADDPGADEVASPLNMSTPSSENADGTIAPAAPAAPPPPPVDTRGRVREFRR